MTNEYTYLGMKLTSNGRFSITQQQLNERQWMPYTKYEDTLTSIVEPVKSPSTFLTALYPVSFCKAQKYGSICHK